MHASAVLYFLVMLLFLPEPSLFTSSVGYWRQRLRAPVHGIVHLLMAVQLAALLSSPATMAPGAASPENEAWSLVVHLIWPTIHLPLATVPLAVAMPVQLAAAAILEWSTVPYCASETTKLQSGEHYYHLHQGLSKVAKGFPVGLASMTDARVPSEVACCNILRLLKVGIANFRSLHK